MPALRRTPRKHHDSGQRSVGTYGWIVTLVCVLLATASVAQAQRRRRRRPARRPTPAAPAVPTANEESPPAADASEPPAPEVEVAPEPPASRVSRRQPRDAPALGSLQSRYTDLMDELVQLRSRTSVIAAQLFSTRIRVTVENESGDETVLKQVRLTLDGAPIYQSEGNALSDEAREAFEGALAPGFHVFGVEVEQRQRADGDFRYTLRDDYRFEVRPNTGTELRLVIDDDSDVGEAFQDDDREVEGEFEVRTEVEIRQVEGAGPQGQDT